MITIYLPTSLTGAYWAQFWHITIIYRMINVSDISRLYAVTRMGDIISKQKTANFKVVSETMNNATHEKNIHV